MLTVACDSKDQSKRILIVEDDRDIRDALQQALEIEGYTVSAVANGKEGLEYLNQFEHPCVILLDLMMPVMNGWEFLEMRRQMELESVPVVVVSAAGDRAKPFQAQAFIRKPIELDGLIRTIQRYCG